MRHLTESNWHVVWATATALVVEVFRCGSTAAALVVDLFLSGGAYLVGAEDKGLCSQ